MSDINPPPHGTLAITGGYSSGHVMPGLAVAEWAKEALPGVAVRFFGSSDGPEGRWIRDAGHPFHGLQVQGVRHLGIRGRLDSTLRFGRAAREASRAFARHDVRALVSIGSYAAVAPVLAASLRRLPVVVFEPNAFPGLANRMAGMRAAGFFVSRLWEGGDRRVEFARPPIRSALRRTSPRTPPAPEGLLRLLVLGGSLGHGFLNARLPELVGELRARGRRLEVRHQCGRDTDASDIVEAYRGVGVDAVVRGFWPDVREQYEWADFAVTAAGSITLHELAAQRLPALVVPLQLAADAHQDRNAHQYSKVTCSPVETESTWTAARVADRLHRDWSDATRWATWDAGCETFDRTPDDEPWQRRLTELVRG